MLVYCKDNLPKVQISTRTYEDKEEEKAEEEIVLEKEATMNFVEGSAKFRHAGSGKRPRLSNTLEGRSQAENKSPSHVGSRPPPVLEIDED